ncbi:MAG: tRNA-guanine transglycosylase, partial [Muribaculaceae bacterium]|nr:tRNA-guanine transglycosylase [Muribaculaceae bacterium]
KWARDFEPIQADGAADVDREYSRAYLHHLFKAQEILAMQIASIHNLAFYLSLVGQARAHILAGDFASWKVAKLEEITRRL